MINITGRLQRAESKISFLFLPQNDILIRITISHIRNTRYAIFLWFESVFDRSFHVPVYRFAVFQQCRLGLPFHTSTTDSNCCHRKRRGAGLTIKVSDIPTYNESLFLLIPYLSAAQYKIKSVLSIEHRQLL